MPRPHIYSNFDEAVADLPDGISVAIAGFGAGTPVNLLTAIWHQGAKDMTVIANGIGFPSPNPDIKLIGDLIVDGRVKRVVSSFTAGTKLSQPGIAETLIRDGTIEAELVPQGTLAERIRAGGAGIPAFYTPTGVGTNLAAGRETRKFNGRDYLLEYSIVPDVSLIRAWKADTVGNLIFRRSARNFNPIMAMAASTTIVEVEQPIVPAGELPEDQIHTPGLYVHRLVHIPPGGILRVHRATGAPLYQTEIPETKPQLP